MANRMKSTSATTWLRKYYLLRGLVSAAWVAAAVAVGRSNPTIATVLLVAYPAWDALANFIDAQRSGGLKSNPTQAFNVVVSVITTLAVATASGHGMNAVLGVFAAWASLSGVLQLVTAVRRRKQAGAQWAMILSGAQSAVAGAFFIKAAAAPQVPDIGAIAGYAGFGAFYFLLSAILLTITHRAGRSTDG